MRKKFYLSQTDKKIAGVCGGIADYLDVDSTIVRIVSILLTLLYITGPLAYIIIWAVAPREPECIGEQQNDKAQDCDHYDKG